MAVCFPVFDSYPKRNFSLIWCLGTWHPSRTLVFSLLVPKSCQKPEGWLPLPRLNYPQSPSKSYLGGGLLQGYGWEGLEAVRSWCSAASVATSWNPREVKIANCCARYVVRLVPTLNRGTQVRPAVKCIQWGCNRGFFGSFQHRQFPSRLREQRVRLEFEVVTRQQGFYIILFSAMV